MPRNPQTNAEIHDALTRAERAAREGDPKVAQHGFFDAGERARRHRLWRTALRAFCSALELDVVDRLPLARIVGLAGHLDHAPEWAEYARVVERSAWPHFGCRDAQVVSDDAGALVECRGVGPVIELAMTGPGLVDAYPDGAFARMPLAMGLLILRCALWTSRRPATLPARTVQIAFAGRPPVELDELGNWRPAPDRA